jgi:predicted transcriptional regulator of viral defense system
MTRLNSTPVPNVGPLTSHLLSTLFERDQYLFTSRDARRIVRRNASAANKLLHTLARQGYIQRLEKGKFILQPGMADAETVSEHEFLMAMQLVQPSYIAYWTALHYHGLTEQLANVVFVATLKQKKAMQIHGITYRFITLAKSKFFGIETQQIGGRPFQISDPEKTIVDCFAHPEYCGGVIEAAKGLWNGLHERRLDLDKLTHYAERLGNRAVLKRIGYLIEFYQVPVNGHLTRWLEHLSAGYNPLDPLGSRRGTHNARWHLLINRNPIELSDWRIH